MEEALPAVSGLSALSYSTQAGGVAMQAAVQDANANMDMDMENRVETAVTMPAAESMDFSILAAWQEIQGNAALESDADRLGSVFLEEVLNMETMLEPWAYGEVMDIPENDIVPTVENRDEYFNSALVLFEDAQNDVY